MTTRIVTRRAFGAGIVGGAITAAGAALTQAPPVPSPATTGALTQDHIRDYPEPTFKPAFKKPRLHITMVQDFVIFGHYDLEMVKKRRS